ncbi:MAG TPA: transglycosylase SLT domain-containing protein [Spirochaetia bacterium]|nr:transglycosylase SLT domain-containing protein [Spirochaetia bacterium]
MGWDTLRRKDLTAAALALVVSAAAAGAVESPASALPAESTGQRGVTGTGPLPALQGHRGEELYSLDMPDEEVIGRYTAGLLAQKKDWLQGVLDRRARYRCVIAAAVEARGMPREMAFLPAVESGFQAFAVSPRGAAGLWQLMRNTASPLGLRMDQWLDERRDFWKATEASLDKLEDNDKQFGDWYLALAAYNCGAGRLSAILRRFPDSDFWTLRRRGVLPRETAAFVPQFLALARILGYPGRYGLTLDWDPSPAWSRVPLQGCVDLRILARESGVPFDVLTAGNPELNFPITPPGSYRYMLKVPQEYEQAVVDTLALASVPLMQFNIHVVKTGDTLSEIARRYRISVEVIQQFNPRIVPRALQVGTRVLIPMTRS